jgi:uncharacterized protein
MKLHRAAPSGENMFTGYGPGYVAVNNVRYEKSIVVTSAQVTDWNIANFEALGTRDFEFLLTLQPEIVVLGTGSTQRFPAPILSRALAEAGVGFEIMDTKAACRTFNILVAEGRRAVAAILIA